ncbi:MAG: cytochrome b/b6 domain-containing protein [Paracoccus sp. (in: a-proteobacteria)]|nr:cytochrome b/b6 domain-containing protein [Paracoccus sp. (in: a-proteobacteria)]
MARYAPAQIALHWIIAALIVLQYFTSEFMGGEVEHAGEGAAGSPLLHVLPGALILLLAIWRIALRARLPQPPRAPDWTGSLASGVHWAFYALLFLLPLTGLAAFALGIEAAGALHEAMTTILLVLIALHVAGGLYHHFIRRDDTLARMLPFLRR